MSFLLIAGTLKNANAVTYYSQAGGSQDINTLNYWNSNRLGGGTNPANLTTAGNIFVIQGSGNGGTSPHSVTTSVIATISGSGSKLQIEIGATLTSTFAVTIGGTAIFQVDNGGTYVHNNIGTPSSTIYNGTESFGATSFVRIDNWTNNTTILTTGVTLPFGNFEINWTTNISAWNQQWSGAINLTAGDFKLTSIGTSAAVLRFASGTNYTLTIGGNYIQNCVGSVVASQTIGIPTVNVAGNFTITSGNFIAANGSGNVIINVAGNFSESGGTCGLVRDIGNANMNISGTCSLTGGNIGLVSAAAGTGTGTFTVSGNTTLNVTGTDGVYFQSAGTGTGIFQTQNLTVPSTSTSTRIVDFGAGTIPNNEFRIKGNFSKAGTGTFYTLSATAAKGFVFNGTGTLALPQTLSYSGTTSDYTNYVVNSGTAVKLLTNLTLSNLTGPVSSFTVNGTLDCSTLKLSSSGANTLFFLNSGAILASANTAGIVSGTTGSVSSNITSAFNAAANYIFNGTLAQVTNFATAGQNMANLTIQNSAGVSLNGTVTVNGTITLTTGIFTIASDLTMGASASTVDNAAVSLNSGVTWDCAGGQVTGTGAVTINGIFKTSKAAGFNGTISTAIANTISSLTIAVGSTIDYSRTLTQTITSANYGNLTNSGDGPRTFSSTGIIGIATSFSPGTGLYSIGTSTVNYNGTTNISAFPVPPVASGGNYYNLQITATGIPLFTMTSSITVANDFTINTTGTFRISSAAANTLTVNNLFLIAGTFTGNTGTGLGATLNVVGNYNQSGGTLNFNNSNGTNNGTAAMNVTGNFVLSGGDAGLGNGATNAATSLTITGNYDQTLASTFELLNGNGATGNVTVTVSGTTTVNTTGTAGINIEAVTSTSGTGIFQANGDATFSGTSTALVDFGLGTVSGNEFRIKGNFSKSGTGTFTTSSINTNSAGATGFVFNGTGTSVTPQTLTYSSTSSDRTSYQVNNGTVVQMQSGLVLGASNNPFSNFTVIGTLECGLFVISGGSSSTNGNNTGFFLTLGATLKTKNTGGVLGTITALETNYNAAANYVFNNPSVAQTSAFKSNPQQMQSLTINNPNGVTLNGSATIGGLLSFTSGIITTSTNFITLNTGASVAGAGTSNYVNGNVLWVYPTSGSATLDFPIGSSSAYAPVTLAINGIGGTGQVFISGYTLTGSEPNEAFPIPNSSGIDQTKKSANYWTLSKSGSGTFTNYDVSFTIANTVNTGTPTSYVVRKFDPPNVWTATTLGTQTSSVTQATGLTSFSEFEVGEPNTIGAATDPTDATICDGDNISFTSTSTSSPVPDVWWHVNTGSGFVGLSNGGVYSGVFSNTLVITGATAVMSTYKYRAKYTNINGNANSGFATLTVNSVPVNGSITSITGPIEACINDVAQYTANSVGGPGITYSWNATGSSSTVLFSNSSLGPWSSPPFATSGNTVWAQFGNVIGSGYSVCANAVNSCGSNIANKCTFIRGKVSVPGTISGSIVACPGTVKTYSCVASGGASLYTWTLGGSTSPITAGQGSNTGVDVTYPVGFTSAQLCVTAALSCGTSSTSAPRCITVSKTPAIPGAFTSGPSKVCPGETNVLFTIPAVTNASTYGWTSPVGTTIVESPPFGTSIHVNFPNPYTGAPPVCVTAKSSCSASAANCKTVGSNLPGQPGSMSGPANNACGTTVNYAVVLVTGADAGYTWTYPGSATNVSGQGTNAIQFDLNSTFTSGIVSVTANTALCTPGTSIPRTITINGKPATPGTIIPGQPSWCSGATIGFSVANPVGPVPTYNWTITNGTNLTGQGTNSVTVTWGTTGVPSSGPVKVSASNTCGVSSIKSQTFSTACREEAEAFTANVSGLTIYPNPAHDKLTVDIDIKENENVILQFMDVSGRIVLSQIKSGSIGWNTYELNLSHFAKGIYILEVKSAHDSRKTKVVIE